MSGARIGGRGGDTAPYLYRKGYEGCKVIVSFRKNLERTLHSGTKSRLLLVLAQTTSHRIALQ